MRTFSGLFLMLVLACGLSAQSRGSATPTVSGSFGSVVFPGGTPATSPGVTRSFGTVVNPGGGGPHVNVPGGVVPGFGRPVNGRPVHRTPVTTFAYPVYYGNYGGYSDAYAGDQGGPQGAPQQQPPNVTVVMPPSQPVTPVIINIGPGGGQYSTGAPRQEGIYEPSSRPDVEEPAPADEPVRYLIAFKDHTIYSALAYWVDGDTLHYFTSGNTHNQVSVSLVDRALTQRLNKESGVEFKLPVK